jgi:short-subunit dehydrogenase
LSARGYAVLLAARRADRLQRLASELSRDHGVEVEVWPCDLCDGDQRARLGEELAARHVAILCNNAGFATCAPLCDGDPAREADEMAVNAVAVHELTLAVLPAMLARGEGAILVTGSTAGEQPVPTAATYSATKAFANTFAQALHAELRGTGVSCTLLAPGPVRTEFAHVGGVAHIEEAKWFAWMTPDRVAEQALAGLERGRRVVIPGPGASLQAFAGRHLPRPLLFALLRAVVLPRLRASPARVRGRERGRARDALLVALAACALGVTAGASRAQAAPVGSFSTPFAEPTIGGTRTDANCVPAPRPRAGLLDNEPHVLCKPAAVSVNILPNGKIMYFDAFEGTENIEFGYAFEYGFNAVNDQSRLLDLRGGPANASWSVPTPVDGGANPNGDPTHEALLPAPLTVNPKYNAGALFCSDNVLLADGRVLANGGTDYYLEPGVKVGHLAIGVLEEEGIRQSRIYDPSTNTWAQTGSMHYGRWYPSSVELPDGNIFTAGGVTKVIKPVYLLHPQDSLATVRQTETYDVDSGRWRLNPSSANHSFPLYPRLHLLPNGHVYYDPGGQPLAVFGQSLDELTWNKSAVYDPDAQRWRDLGIPGLTDLAKGTALDVPDAIHDAVGTLLSGGIPGGGRSVTIPGYRGSTFSIELPLVPDASGRYTSASFLAAGGTINPSGPGSYVATSDSRITTIDTSGPREISSTRPTGDLKVSRWFSSAVLLPTGQVVVFNGSDRDQTLTPGLEIPRHQTELFDPATNRWQLLAPSHQARTYHNTAVLLPDGRVLISGHAPLPTLFLRDITIPGGFAPNDGRDPTFEIFSPPYLSWGARPSIVDAPRTLDYGRELTVTTDVPTSQIESVVLVSNPALTHLVDANQRNVVLPVVARDGNRITVRTPPSGNVAPPGAYMLFVNKRTPNGLVPSTSTQTFVGLSTLRRR